MTKTHRMKNSSFRPEDDGMGMVHSPADFKILQRVKNDAPAGAGAMKDAFEKALKTASPPTIAVPRRP